MIIATLSPPANDELEYLARLVREAVHNDDTEAVRWTAKLWQWLVGEISDEAARRQRSAPPTAGSVLVTRDWTDKELADALCAAASLADEPPPHAMPRVREFFRSLHQSLAASCAERLAHRPRPVPADPSTPAIHVHMPPPPPTARLIKRDARGRISEIRDVPADAVAEESLL